MDATKSSGVLQNAPEIRTERLILRKFTENDAEALFLILRDKEVNTFLPWFPTETLEEAKAYLYEKYLKDNRDQKGYQYAICMQQDGFPIGYVHVSGSGSHDLGYGLRKEFWHWGIVTEACMAVIRQLKADGLPFVTATHDVNNPRSGEVMKKIGMKYRYSYQEQWQPKNIPVTFRMYQLNLDETTDHTYKEYWDKYPHFIEENI